MSATVRVLVALVLGFVAGTAIELSKNSELVTLVSWITPLGVLWINAIKMTVIPLVMSLIVVSVVSFETEGAVARIGAQTFGLFVGILGMSAFIAVIVAPIAFARMPVGLAAIASHAAAGPVGETKGLPAVAQWIEDLVPANPVRAAADAALLPLVIFSLLFAMAARSIDAELRGRLLGFFNAVRETMMVLVRWIIALAPVGVFALVLAMAAHTGLSVAGALGYFVVVVCALISIQTILLYPIASMLGRVPVARFASAVLPAQAVAASSRSSLASLPALIDGAQNTLRLAPPASALVLPLAVSTFKISAPMFWVTGAVFLTRLYGIDFDLSRIALLATFAVAMSFGSPGIPNGGLLLMMPLYTAFGLPATGVALLIAADFFPDLFRSVANVTGDLAVAAIAARSSAKSHEQKAVADAVPPPTR
jgi:proton glutamate symport protein